jgi:cytochrome P450
VLGNVLALRRDPLRFLTGLARDYGDVVSFRVGMQRAVLINQPALIDRIVRDRRFVRSAQTRRGLSSLLGNGLLSLEGAPHLRHRRLMQPAFHRERIRRYVAIMADETYRVLERWRGGEVRELREEMMRLTFSIVARSLFNTDTTSDADNVHAALKRALPAVLNSTMLSRVSPVPLPPLYGRSTRAAIGELHDLVRAIVQRRRREGDDRGDLLSMLLATRDEDGSALSDEEVCAETLTILLAGHDTTAHTLTWAWYLLTMHPTIQEALATEVRAVVGERAVTDEDLPRLQLADRVVRETLRLYPAAWWADRIWDEPTELGGFAIPANTLVVFSTYVTQRDGRYFPDPERFDPDRFLPERAAKMADGAYLPFGAGVHVCIGNTFALMEARLILAAIAQRFVVRATQAGAVRPKPLVTLGMERPFPVELTSRPHANTNEALALG